MIFFSLLYRYMLPILHKLKITASPTHLVTALTKNTGASASTNIQSLVTGVIFLILH